jgi:hypothetical protein
MNSSIRSRATAHRTVSAIPVLLGAGLLDPLAALAAGVPGELDEVVVTARRLVGLTGRTFSATVGTVLGEQLETRPMLRTGEVLEVVPGLVVTQHSGSGKANQYFLRGFNLDHGTDFASRVEGIPVNMPTHAHGQGYSDINFMIPELVDRIEYRKGTYYADEGNFSAAGSVDVSYRRRLEHDEVLLVGGEHDYGRALLAASPQLAGGDLLFALDTTHDNGPWELAEHSHKYNGVIKYTQGDAQQGFSLAGMGYRGSWRATDQIPLRAVQSGELGRFGYVDDSDGGRSRRYSLSASLWQPLGEGSLRATGYAMDYGLDLFSNFSYFTDAVNGDQFEQYDERRVYGLSASYRLPVVLAGRNGNFRGGADWRHDGIPTVGLYRTRERERLSIMREDAVTQNSYSLWASQDLAIAAWLRAEAGLRFDAFHFQVASNIAANSGQADDRILSPKLAVVFGPWDGTELFLNWGRGFHSNDARGTTIRVDPADGVTPTEPVTPLVRATGREIGLRSAVVPGLQLAGSLWELEVASELLFIGDGGITEASRASRRRGVELSAYYTPSSAWIIDADVAFTRPRFSDNDPVGRRIPNAVERVISCGVSYHDASWSGGIRLRHLGPAALLEDNSRRSEPVSLVNLEVGYRFTNRLSATAALFNVFGARANDITYFYESRLPGESAPVEDVHFHPVEPRTLRLALTARL